MSETENFSDYPKHPGQTTPRPYYVEIPLETFETMSKELAELRNHELAWNLDKARIKELEAENESLKYSVATLDTDIAMMKRWRKFSEEKPDDKHVVLVSDGEWFETAFYHDDGSIDFGDDIHFSNITEAPYWMPLPKAPKEAK